MSEYQGFNGELQEGQTVSAEQLGDYSSSYVLLPEGDYDFTVVKLEKSRYQPKPTSKIGACVQVTLTLRVVDPQTGKPVDLTHNLYMWGTTVGMIAQYQDAIGIHKKGEPLTFDWRPDVHIGKTGKLKITHREYTGKDGAKYKSNNINRLYPKEAQNSAPAWKGGY